MFTAYDKLNEIALALSDTSSGTVSPVLITAHVKPDADAVGSALALGLSLREAGREVYFCLQDKPPKTLAFLPGSQELFEKNGHQKLPENSVLFVLDCNELTRIGAVAQDVLEASSRVFVLDHHIKHSPLLGQDEVASKILYECCDTGACATCAIVYRFLKLAGLPITLDVAINLYAGMLTDTGSFRYSNTEAETFEIAAELVKLGVVPNHLTQALYQTYPLSRQRLLGESLLNFEMACDDKVAVMCLTPEMYRKSGASEEDSHDFVSFIREIDTVEVAAFIKEIETGVVAGSLRSKKYFDVETLARSFGGGGHFHAAGFHLRGVSAQQVKVMLLERLSAAFAQQ